jgi:extracellular matrix regulatory protein A
MAELLAVGHENYLALDRVIAIAPPGAAPLKRAIQSAKEHERLIDLTSGRRTKAILVLEDGWVALVAITPETIASRTQALRMPRPAALPQVP